MIRRHLWDNLVIITRDGDTDEFWDGKVKNLVYDQDSMSWVAQSAGEIGGGGGDASSANQVTGNASLASIDSKLPVVGQALAAASLPVTLSNENILDQYIVGAGPSTAAINTNILLAVQGTGSLDMQQYRSIAFQVVTAAATTAVAVLFEGSHDNTTFSPVQLYDNAAPNTAPVTTFTTAAGVNRFFQGTIPFRYFRVRLNAAIVAGSVRTYSMLRMTTFNPTSLNVVQSAAASLNATVTGTLTGVTTVTTVSTVTAVTTVSTVTTVGSITSANLSAGGIIADVASAALAITTTTAAMTPTYGAAYKIVIPVTAVTGSSPVLDVRVQESPDSGTNWYNVYDFPRITATGVYSSPMLPLTGNRVRYVQTVAGSTPSFTRAINRIQSSWTGATIYRQLIDRTVTLTSLNSVTPALDIETASRAQLVINIGTATGAPALQIEGSDDGTTYYAIGNALTAVASSTVQLTVVDINARFIRARVSSAGDTVVASYVLLKAFN